MKTVRMLPAATALLVTLGAWGSCLTAQAVPTDIVVRAIANDAKLIGSGVGGAHIVIRDAQTGDVLAEGLHEGSTGDTRAIVGVPELCVESAHLAGALLALLSVIRRFATTQPALPAPIIT